jgi:hypothetical protein
LLDLLIAELFDEHFVPQLLISGLDAEKHAQGK